MNQELQMTPCAASDSSAGITHGVALDDKKAKRRDYNKKYRATPAGRANRKKEGARYRSRENGKKVMKFANAKYRANNKDKIKAKDSKYSASPKGRAKSIAKYHFRRARKISATIGDHQAIFQWQKKWRSYKRVICYWCGSSVAGKMAHADHIVPLSKKGAHSIENMCISCASCNCRKSAKALTDWNKELSQPVLF